jgi:predicted DNA-binding transcriptional regulator AlpA
VVNINTYTIMEVPTFTQTQLDVAEIKNGYIKILDHLNQRIEFVNEDKDPKNIDDVVELTGYTKKTIYGYCQNKTIPHCKKNGRLFFFKSEIIEWIQSGKQKTTNEIESENDEFFASKKKRLK